MLRPILEDSEPNGPFLSQIRLISMSYLPFLGLKSFLKEILGFELQTPHFWSRDLVTITQMYSGPNTTPVHICLCFVVLRIANTQKSKINAFKSRLNCTKPLKPSRNNVKLSALPIETETNVIA